MISNEFFIVVKYTFTIFTTFNVQLTGIKHFHDIV